MFDPEFSLIVNEMAASKEIIKNKKYSSEYKNKTISSFKDKLKYFYGENLDDKLLDILYHDAYKLVFESNSEVKPELSKDGWVTAYVDDKENISGFITKRKATKDNNNAYNLYIESNNIIKKYNFYDNAIIMICEINNLTFIKLVRLNNNVVEYTLFRNNSISLSKLIESDEYNIKDVLNAYTSCINNERIIKLLFPEIFERKPYNFSIRTRK